MSYALPIAAVILLVVIWQEFVTILHVNSIILPPPSAILLNGLIPFSGFLLGQSIATVIETVLGFAGGAALGIILGILVYYSRILRRTIMPLVLFAQTLPKVAIAPLFVLWFGLGLESKIIISLLIAFFPVLIDTVAGFNSVPSELHELSGSFHASARKSFIKIDAPYAMPHVFSGLKVAITLALIGAIVGEFVAANEGLGYVVLVSEGTLQSDLLFASLITLAILGALLYGAVVLLERITIPWYSAMRTNR